jgi:hypothetical protein
MTDERLVECQDCGYRWKSSASSPRCSKADCGRSRNVEPVQDGGDSVEQDGDDLDDEDDDRSTGDPDDVDPEDGGFTPSFESREQTADHVEANAPDLDDDVDDDEDDEQDGDDADKTEPTADPADEVPDLDPEQLKTGFDLTFDVVANQRGDHWRLDEDEDEAEKLAKAWTPVMNHYAPVLFREHTEVGIAVVATVSIVGPRLAEDRRRAERQKEREQAARDGEPGEPRDGSVVEDDDAVDDAETWNAPDDEPTDTQSGWANV